MLRMHPEPTLFDCVHSAVACVCRSDPHKNYINWYTHQHGSSSTTSQQRKNPTEKIHSPLSHRRLLSISVLPPHCKPACKPLIADSLSSFVSSSCCNSCFLIPSSLSLAEKFEVLKCPALNCLFCFSIFVGLMLPRDGSGISNGGDDGGWLRPMDADQLRECGHRMVDFVADYYKSIETFPVLSQVQARHSWVLTNPAV